jgi:transcriptional regulator with XRE-family HTH domain
LILKNKNDYDQSFLIQISTLIRQLRLEKGISQEKFSHLIQIDRKYASLIEKGDKNLSILMLKKIVDGLEISMEDFFKKFEN